MASVDSSSYATDGIMTGIGWKRRFRAIAARASYVSQARHETFLLTNDPFRKLDAVVFQSDFAAGETRSFPVSAGAKQVFNKEQFKAFGRFNSERFDDFAWENNKTAHRTYGKPLACSTIDIWSKRTPRMVVNDWRLTDDYHVDHGDGADFYSAGASRGCGEGGLWAADGFLPGKSR